jgi:hypothetical protein
MKVKTNTSEIIIFEYFQESMFINFLN